MEQGNWRWYALFWQDMRATDTHCSPLLPDLLLIFIILGYVRCQKFLLHKYGCARIACRFSNGVTMFCEVNILGIVTVRYGVSITICKSARFGCGHTCKGDSHIVIIYGPCFAVDTSRY